MKTSDNTRRTKTHPDQSSMFSTSSNKSLFSTDRKSSVRIACKVMNEMREDNNDKLQMKFTQLRIVLASQSIIHLLRKCRTTKLQDYFQTLKTTQRKTVSSSQIKPKLSKQVQFKDQSHYYAGFKIISSIHTIKLFKAFQLIQANKYHLKGSQIQQQRKKLDGLVNIFNRRVNMFFIRMKQINQIKKGLNTINLIFQGHKKKVFYSTFLNIAQSIHQRKSIHYQTHQFINQDDQENQQPLTQYKISLLTQSFEYIDLQDRVSVCSGSQTYEDEEINSENEFMTMTLAVKFASTTILSTTMNTIILKNLFHVYNKLQNITKNDQPKTNTVQNTQKSNKKLELLSPQSIQQDIHSLKFIESKAVSLAILPETPKLVYMQPVQTINSEQDDERERQKMIAANKLKNLFLFQLKVNFIHFRINLLEVNLEILPTVQSNKSDSSLKYYRPKSSKQKQTASQKKLQAFVKKIYKEDTILTNFSSSQQKSTDNTYNLDTGQKQKQQQIKVEQYQNDFMPEGLNHIAKIPTKKSLIFNSSKPKQIQTNKVSEAVKSYLVTKTDSPLQKSVYLEQNLQPKQLKEQSFFKMNKLLWIQLCIVIPLIIGSVLII